MATREQIENITVEDGRPAFAVYAADGSMIAPVPPEFMTDQELDIFFSQSVPNYAIVDKYGVKSQNINSGRTVADVTAERFDNMPSVFKAQLNDNQLKVFNQAKIKRDKDNGESISNSFDASVAKDITDWAKVAFDNGQPSDQIEAPITALKISNILGQDWSNDGDTVTGPAQTLVLYRASGSIIELPRI